MPVHKDEVEEGHIVQSANVITHPVAPEMVNDSSKIGKDNGKHMDVPEGLFTKDEQRFYMGEGSFRTIAKGTPEYDSTLNEGKRLHQYCTSVGINPCLSNLGTAGSM